MKNINVLFILFSLMIMGSLMSCTQSIYLEESDINGNINQFVADNSANIADTTISTSESTELIDNNNKEEEMSSNNLTLFFFPDSTEVVDYKGFINPLNSVELEQDLKLQINNLGSFEQGDLFTLEIVQIEANDPLEQISKGRNYLGYFFVTEDTIYCKKLRNYIGYTLEDNRYVTSLIENDIDQFYQEAKIVYTEASTDDSPDENGWCSYVEIVDDECKYFFYSIDTGATRFYEKMVWTKGKGLTYYKAGEGSMLMHLEFSDEDSKLEKNSIVNPNYNK